MGGVGDGWSYYRQDNSMIEMILIETLLISSTQTIIIVPGWESD